MASEMLAILPPEYHKKLSEQTDGGEKPLSASERGFVTVATDAKVKNYDAHKREWASRGQFVATDAMMLPTDAHGHNFRVSKLSEMETIERKD